MSDGPRILVWTIAFREKYEPLVRMWHESLRKIGKWRGDVTVLGDCNRETHLEGRTRWCNVWPFLEYDPDRARHGFNSAKPYVLKATAGLWDRYDFIFYNDCDVLVNSDRVTALLERAAARGRIVVQRDWEPISSRQNYTAWRDLTEAELARYADDSICAGIVGFPNNEAGRAALSDWHQANAEEGFNASDQRRLILLLLRKYAGQWDYLPETAFGGKAGHEPHPLGGPTWIHFANQKHVAMAAHYHKVLGLE